jgi:HTH-type transcriptional regulator / antitoxin HigA
MKNIFPTTKYPITPITDEATYLRLADWLEEIDDLEFEQPAEEQKRVAHAHALMLLITDYETKHFNLESRQLTVQEVIEQALEQLNLSKKDLTKILGANRVSEIFSGERSLSLAQRKKLHKTLHIPAAMLLMAE